MKVAIIGPESSGKSVLARYLANRYKGTYVPEYARTYIEQKGTRDVTYDELCAIARHQIDQLKSLDYLYSNSDSGLYSNSDSGLYSNSDSGLYSNSDSGLYSYSDSGLYSNSEAVFFFDTELIVTKVWFDYAFGHIPEWLEPAIRAYPMDTYLLTYPDLPWVPDPARYNGSDAIRLELFQRYESEIQALNIPYYIIKHELD